jgi:NAD(P)-dependent dehydrogenase (short-subunit alcohol dehydrogenase family)
VNLTGVYNTVEATKTTIFEQGEGGSIILISSAAGLIGIGPDDPGAFGYGAAKHGVVGLMRIYARARDHSGHGARTSACLVPPTRRRRHAQHPPRFHGGVNPPAV